MEIGGSVHGLGSWDGGGADPVDPVVGLRVVADRLLLSDVGGLDGGCLHERIVALRAEQSRLEVMLAELLAEWDARRCWESNAQRSTSLGARHTTIGRFVAHRVEPRASHPPLGGRP